MGTFNLIFKIIVMIELFILIVNTASINRKLFLEMASKLKDLMGQKDQLGSQTKP